MALTIARLAENIPLGRGDKAVGFFQVTFDNSYPTGGEAIAASDFGFDSIDFADVNSRSDVTGKTVAWDRANSKLLVYTDLAADGISAEAANASDQSAVIVRLAVYGSDR